MNIGAEFAVVQMNCFNILKQIPTVGVIGISWWFYSEREMSMATLLLTSLFLNICIEHQLQIRWCREACLRDTSQNYALRRWYIPQLYLNRIQLTAMG